MSVHYKFKSALDFDTITFDGLHISVNDLKKAIIHQKRLGKTVDFDLQITNAQTKEEYFDDGSLIPKNTSLIIARIPLAKQPKKSWEPSTDKNVNNRTIVETETTQVDLSRMNGSEEDKIQAMMVQSTMDYDPNNYQKIRGANQIGEVPMNYRCFKCHKQGHWIKNCPLAIGIDQDVKRNTGIPRSFIEREGQVEGKVIAQQAPLPPEPKHEIPEDLICGICKNIFVDAVMIPCCGSSFCDECVRTALLESEDNECPDCKEKGSSPGSLIPNRFLRNSVNSFKNETGYNKPRVQQSRPKPKLKTEEVVPKEDEIEVEVEKPILDVKEEEEEEEEKQKSKVEIITPKVVGVEKEENESDYEDNITVTVPPPHLTSHGAYKERHLLGRHARHLKPPGLDTPPKHQAHYQNVNQDERSATPTVDEKEVYNQIPSTDNVRIVSLGHTQHQPLQIHHGHHIHRQPESSLQSQNGYGEPNPMHFAQHSVASNRTFDGDYGMQQNNYPPAPQIYEHAPTYHNERPRPPYMGNAIRGGYGPPQHHIRHPRMMEPQNSLASLYQGVAAKVGPGIIDDPLEAFNRIMREKERRKEEAKRRSPHMHRRSRSHDMDRRRSPGDRRRSPNDRRMRTPEDRRGRSHDRISEERDRRRRRSSSYSRSSRSSSSYSRSRSRSPPRKRSRSPMMRKRSRTPPRRSRSRSMSFNVNRYGRFRGDRDIRRDGFKDHEFRDRSPYNNHQFQNSRGRGYRGRGRGTNMGHYRQDRPIFNQSETNYSQNSTVTFHDNNQYSAPINRYPPREQQQIRIQNYNAQSTVNNQKPDMRYENNVNIIYNERFEDGPPGTDEPPPPGFESSAERYERDAWNKEQRAAEDEANFKGQNFRDDYRRPPGDFVFNKKSPMVKELERDRGINPNDERRHDEVRNRGDDLRSNANQRNDDARERYDAPNFDRKKRSRSKSVNKWNARKDNNYISKDRIKDHEKERKDEKNSRDEKKTNSESIKEKEKKRDSSDEEKREKKSSKDKKKRKKETEKKKYKKEKREKREKDCKKDLIKEKKISISDTMQLLQANIIETIENIVHEESKPMFTPPKKMDTETDLYSDIVDDNVTNELANFITDMNNGDELNELDHSILPATLNKTDSILDIHPNLDFGPELEENEHENNKKIGGTLVGLPEPSKWEIEEDGSFSNERKTEFNDSVTESDTEDKSKVTNEVLKRAENAIFARAINAIRPIEIKKISVERQKLYSNDKFAKEQSPVLSVCMNIQSPILETVQITVPVNSNTDDRSVEIKSETKRPSIKDRLGNKVSDNERKSRSKTPQRKTTGKQERIISPNRNQKKNTERNCKQLSDENSREQQERKNLRRSEERRGGIGNYDQLLGSGSRDRDRRNFKEDEKRNKPRDISKTRDKIIRKSKERNRSREKDYHGRNKNSDGRGKQIDNSREQMKNKERHRSRERPKSKDKMKIKNQSKERKRERSRSDSIDRRNRKDKKYRKEKDEKRDKKLTDSLIINKLDDQSVLNNDDDRVMKENVKKLETLTNEVFKIMPLDRKRSTIDEANFIPDYDEQMEQEHNDDIKIDLKKNIVELENKKDIQKLMKLDIPERKRIKSSSDSSTSSDSTTDSSIDSDESNRKRKKRKSRKQKKFKRVSSSDTDETPKKKKKKDKKKASKKKKKGKHK